jgi:hypothetical protein
VLPPPGSGERGTLAGERGVGRVPIPKKGHTLWNFLYTSFVLKGIDRPFQGGVKSSLIRSLFINWRLGNFFSLILKGFHHKISKKLIDAA